MPKLDWRPLVAVLCILCAAPVMFVGEQGWGWLLFIAFVALVTQ